MTGQSATLKIGEPIESQVRPAYLKQNPLEPEAVGTLPDPFNELLEAEHRLVQEWEILGTAALRRPSSFISFYLQESCQLHQRIKKDVSVHPIEKGEN